jgi:hypothetical protein
MKKMKMSGTNILRRSARKSQGLKRPTLETSNLDYSVTITCDDGGEMASQPVERERKVKFMLPEVTDVQISYRVPAEDKYRFYYTKRNIAFFKREAFLERLPTYTDTATEVLSRMFSLHFPSRTLANEQGLQPSSEGRQCKIGNNDDDTFQKEYASCAGRMGFGISLL